ncbi:MAG TPA: glycosyl hydrolase, partial [Flavisolibacter sp.]|nr:glycosyl hydrolase [Flavisolibacter sp.]
MHRRSFIKNCGAISLVVWVENKGLMSGLPAPQKSTLEEVFSEPPAAALPQVFWFWMNGHVTKEGITLDLEAMKKAGIGGLYNYDSGISIPQGPIRYYSPEWIGLKQHAVNEAKRLGLDYVMHNCPGWSSSGGPWITPEMAMQQITSSEMVVEGGTQIAKQLPLPFHKLGYYRDVAVVAFPSQEGEIDLQNYAARTNSGPVNREAVSGENPAGVMVLPASETEDAWLLFEFVNAAEVRFLTFLISAVPGAKPQALNVRTSVVLEASDNGIEFVNIAAIGTGLEAELAAGDKFITYDIKPTKAKFFRLRSPQARRYSQVRFSGIDRLKNFMEKTGNRFLFSGEETSPLYQDYPQQSPSAINSRQVLDLTDHVNSDGFLQWAAPPGKWTIMRFGLTPTGAINKAAPENGSGLECDKFSKAAVDYHFQKTMEKLSPVLRQISLSGKVGLSIDSYEAGPQTWTEKFPGEFQQRCGYSVLPYLPALTGRMVDSAEHTERFLWDVRK